MGVPSALRRIEAISLDHGVAYPWWMPMTCKTGQVIGSLIAFAQRDRLASWEFPVVVALILVPMVVEFRTGRWLPAAVRVIPNLLAYGLLVMTPLASGTAGLDAATVVLTLVAADSAARDGWRGGLTFAAVATVPLVLGADSDQLLVALLFLALGFEGGFMVHWSARALAAERQARVEAYARATLAERDRIAREIHDLVAHSLSITMLQVTAARRMVADGDDPAEITAALADAESVGRRAMADIRQTVSGMGSGQPRSPLPTCDDLPRLVEDIRSAGQSVEFTLTGDPSTLPDAVGLGLYRVAQESLANVIKHGAGAPAHLTLTVSARDAELVVSNPAARAHQGDGLGSGVAGMRARLEQLGGRLSAGPEAGAWVVRAIVPLKDGALKERTQCR